MVVETTHTARPPHPRRQARRDAHLGLRDGRRTWRLALVAALALGAVAAPPAPMSARAEVADPFANDPSYQRAQQLFGALRETLDEAAQIRLERQLDPESWIEGAFWRQFDVDQQSRIDDLLGAAFEMVTDAPVVDLQRQIDDARDEIAALEAQIAELRELRISAPSDAGWSGWVGLEQERASIDADIADLERRIDGQEAKIAALKAEFTNAMADAGADLPPEQVDLLLESVTGADMVRLAAAYEAVRGVSLQLRDLMDENGEELTYAKRYYGMHTTLIAVLLEAQGRFLNEVDTVYLPRLAAIENDIQAAARETDALMRGETTRAQREVLVANKESQQIALDALRLYREYLRQQRAQIAEAHARTERELRIADNTLRTVEASFQLRQVMESATLSFDALSALESPGFERVFRNERLREEFRELTEQLSPPS